MMVLKVKKKRKVHCGRCKTKASEKVHTNTFYMINLHVFRLYSCKATTTTGAFMPLHSTLFYLLTIFIVIVIIICELCDCERNTFIVFFHSFCSHVGNK